MCGIGCGYGGTYVGFDYGDGAGCTELLDYL